MKREGTKIRDRRQLGHGARVLRLSLATSSHDCFKISHKLAISPNDQAAGRTSNISSQLPSKSPPRVQVFVVRLGSVRACQIETGQKSLVSLNSKL